MDPNTRSLFSAHSNLIDDLHTGLLGVYEDLSALEQAVFAQSLFLEGENPKRHQQEWEKGHLYFHLYTVPLLEAAGLFAADRFDEAVFWGGIQLCFGLHIRYADYLMDNDQTDLDTAQLTKRTQGYLARAQTLLWRKQYDWRPEQLSLYGQYIEYECEVRQGYVHDLSSLWRRVSPLCITGETYLAPAITASNFAWTYRHFLGWSLIYADCDDVLEDLQCERRTPVTALVGEKLTPQASDFAGAAQVMAHIKDCQTKQAQRLLRDLGESFPAWRMIITQMQEKFSSDV